LIKDIDEFFYDTEKENKSYYLGSLVCFKRENGEFELLDGQQRHTTITLINLVLKNWEKNIENTVSEPKLKFDSRKKSQHYLENLYKVQQAEFSRQITELNVEGTGSFKDAIEIIQEELNKQKDDGSKINISKFANNFYNNVFLFRIEVPEDTDLNHYFEIMNNRGEQLEKHEMVKALLMGKIEEVNEQGQKDDEKTKNAQNKFAVVWDACSDMSNYIYFNFDNDPRKNIFDNEGGIKNGNFSEIVINSNGETDNDESLDYILNNHTLPPVFPEEEKYSKEKYKSIIDFPNFLLQVLKLKNENVSLDDKKLLVQFEQMNPDPKEFIFDLLKYRVLFDKYVVKQDLADADDNKQNWGIRKLNTSFEDTIRTFSKDGENDDELVKLQVMLYYSDSTNTYNNWLHDILKFDKLDSLTEYTSKVFEIAKKRFKKDNLSYPEITIFNLYFIDFLLWKLYKEENIDTSLQSLKDKINKHKDLFNTFKFKQISSREHLFSQEHAKRYSIDETIYNGIGNLCLISTSQNSAGNKENPTDKKKMFQNDNSSLKRIIMFESFENEWKKEQIKKHEEEINLLIDWGINL
jgi:uncharacterized protein with ParB-like and HNH nuclease domain